jgi:hypothetical protein
VAEPFTGGAIPREMDKMTRPANRWLLIGAASALAIGMSACNKTPAATDTTNVTVDSTAAPPATTDNTGAMSATNSAGTNTMSTGGGAAPSQ